MAAAPDFIALPLTWHAALSAANTGRDGTGTLVDLTAGGSLGSRVDKVRIQASGTTTAGVVRLFMQDGSGNKRLLREILVEAITPSTTIEAFSKEVTFPEGLNIPNLWTLRCSTHNAETFNAFAIGGNY